MNVTFEGDIRGEGTTTLGQNNKVSLGSKSIQNAIVFNQNSHLQLNNNNPEISQNFSGALTIVGSNSALTGVGMWFLSGNISFDPGLDAASEFEPWLTINTSNAQDVLGFGELHANANVAQTAKLVKTGNGVLDFGFNTRIEGNIRLVVEGGSVQASSQTLQGHVDLQAADATLIFNQDSDGSYIGQLRGEGIFEKRGGGVLTLTSNSQGFTGATAIADGALNVAQDAR